LAHLKLSIASFVCFRLTTPPQAGGVCKRNYPIIFPLTLTLSLKEGIDGNPTASGWGIKKISINFRNLSINVQRLLSFLR
jgi:hypothetical protein